MKTTIATLAIITLSFSQANANDAVKQGILNVFACVQTALQAGEGKPRVHPDAVVVAVRSCHEYSARLQQAFDQIGATAEERNAVAEEMGAMMLRAWSTQ
jgi:hypothetical protein